MTPAMHEFVKVDLAPMVAGVAAAVTCGLLGNFLVLRRLSLMGDAISHAVLPGLVIAFLLSASREPMTMLAGAAVAGIATVVLVEFVHRVGGVEQGAAMGVVFSVLFALGVLLIEQAAARHVDLDADCVLYGNLEAITWWSAPASWGAYLDSATYLGDDGLPRQVITLGVALVLTAAFLLVLFKELRLSSFDPGLSTALGFHAGALHHALMIFVAMAVVAAFEAVGSILVIAMLICPAATARLLTDRLGTQIAVSAAAAMIAGSGGYLLGAFAPVFGAPGSLSASGMMTVVAGLLLALAIFLSPSHGIIARHMRHARLALTIAREDVLGVLYRARESGRTAGLSPDELRRVLGGDRPVQLGLRAARRRSEVAPKNGLFALTEKGLAAAGTVIRSHRLWENYLVRELGLRPDHVHDTAMRLEHLTGTGAERLAPEREDAIRDPHDRPIPSPTESRT